MMLNKYILSSCQKSLPAIMPKRFKVRNLPDTQKSELEMSFNFKPRVGKTFTTEFFAFTNRKDAFTWTYFKARMKRKQLEDMIEDQRFLSERHRILGPNLATTHFICARGGKVRFKGSNIWAEETDLRGGHIPQKYVPGYFVEEIDASNTNLCYEGFQNFCNLDELKKLSLRNCEYVDDWCLNRLHLFGYSLEYLDLSGCKNISERGICTLHSLKKLKTLVLQDTPNIKDKELVSLLLQDVIPNLEVIGVDFNDPELLKRLESL
ncbi:distal membrane-arm assembly complex protein 2 isoform X2 [Parasteatoda tepidariorum]|nr:distal membrane-arm assembly complex protein 2 isoform X2 [Parasteatoda tepidariorum]XP_015908578.1 distal membrane-arm assembly complex protein 2 isoform X2 [Parasteatoda tepidariorum]XP_042901550.1 distal membrane-arm assembly complex protein 2 isoform X2 [Parasteatoda tepidariorum]